MTQASMAVRPSAFGMLVVMVLKMFTRTRKTVMRSVILKAMGLEFNTLTSQVDARISLFAQLFDANI